MEIQSYTNKWGWTTVTIEQHDSAELAIDGATWFSGTVFIVWDLATGAPTYHQDRWQAELHAELLASYQKDYALTHTCAENPAVLHRNGFVTQGHFAGLPVAFEGGVAGVWLFEQFTPLDAPKSAVRVA